MYTRLRINMPLIIRILGLLLIINGLMILICIPVSFIYGDGAWEGIAWAALINMGLGFLMRYLTRHTEARDIKIRDAYIIVTLCWLTIIFFGTLPYLFTGAIPAFSDIFFETTSGYSTTGSSILIDIEALPHSILFWRGLTHWIGGMGIIVLTIAILPLLGIGGMQLYTIESSGKTQKKLHPRIKETAKRLWYIYVILTGILTVLLLLGGMNWFESVLHAMSTVATGGLSPRNDSIGAYDSAYIHYVITLFMFIGGISFALIYYIFKGNLSKLFQNEELRIYTIIVFLSGLFVAVCIYFLTPRSMEEAFRDGMFQTISIISGTGFGTADYTAWAPFLTFFFFILFFTGASTGSTTGSVKMLRHIILFKNIKAELRKLLHPNAVIPIRYNNKAVNQDVVYNVMAFVLVYIGIFFGGTFLMTMMELDLQTAMGAVAANLGNVGPGIGSVGPDDNYAHIPDLGKYFLSFLMLLGRLELFTILLLLTPFFWKGR